MIDTSIKQLADYGVRCGLIGQEDIPYTINRLLEVLHKDEYCETTPDPVPAGLESILKALLDYAASQHLIAHPGIAARDLFDARLMGCLTPSPSRVTQSFWEHYHHSPVAATDFLYKFSQDTDYIRRYRIKKDVRWQADTEYGSLDITINLAKPEKEPADIAAAAASPAGTYPPCLLCKENVGYAGRAGHPARQNHRIIPISLNGAQWYLQYSPYTYYNEHCIALNGKHVPMKTDAGAFSRLFNFIDMFPHYFIGSNADLPIVGGSILSHDHFQGGDHSFAMAAAPIETTLSFSDHSGVTAGIVKWPMSVIRLSGGNRDEVVALAGHILQQWRDYRDADAFIFPYTDNTPHNTITSTARKRGGAYELDLILRNNITTDEHPLGVFHPHADLHHIKKENIGLIEAMGLAVLPARLQSELRLVREAILSGSDLYKSSDTAPHAGWVYGFIKKYSAVDPKNIDDIIKAEVGRVFLMVLEDAGVFKRTREGQGAFLRFASAAGGTVI